MNSQDQQVTKLCHELDQLQHVINNQVQKLGGTMNYHDDHLATETTDAKALDYQLSLHCLAHRAEVRWLPAPMWWHHTKNLRTCTALWDMYAPRVS